MFRLTITDANGGVCQWRSTFDTEDDAQARISDAQAEFPACTVSVEQFNDNGDGTASWVTPAAPPADPPADPPAEG